MAVVSSKLKFYKFIPRIVGSKKHFCVNLINATLDLCSSKWISVCVDEYNPTQYSSTGVL